MNDFYQLIKNTLKSLNGVINYYYWFPRQPVFALNIFF